MEKTLIGFGVEVEIVRHAAAEKSTKIEETVEQAIALLYAPVACIYYLVQSKIHQKKAQYAVVIPVITNLESYALQRLELNHLSYQELYVTGTGDAGLKSLYYLANSKTTDSKQAVRVSQPKYSVPVYPHF